MLASAYEHERKNSSQISQYTLQHILSLLLTVFAITEYGGEHDPFRTIFSCHLDTRGVRMTLYANYDAYSRPVGPG